MSAAYRSVGVALNALTAIVLAGGPGDALVAGREDAPNKAFLPIAGAPLVSYPLTALRATPSIGRIIVVAPRHAHAHPALADADSVRDDGSSIVRSIASGLDGLDPDEPALLVTADLPVLDRAALDEFIDGLGRRDADLAYACVERRAHLARFPEIPHTWARLREGTYCGGGVTALRPRAFARLASFLDRLGRARKNPIALAAILGPKTLAAYAFGRLSIADAERRASDLLGAPCAAIVCSDPAIAVNVDRIGDVALAAALLRRR
jgi:GTP:adenosylcobinamide-phosphate guanylyltransferase